MLIVLAAACGASDGDDASTESNDSGEETSSFEEGEGAGSSDDLAVAAESDAPAGANNDAAAPEVAERDALADDEVDSDAAAEDDSDEGADPLGSGGATVTPTAADLGRKLIFTAEVHVGVDDVAAASAEATSIVEGLGGFVFGQNTVGGAEPSSQLTFKILPDDFNQALEALGAVGELRNQSVTTDDVTERIVDLESRIQVAELGVARLRTALEGAATLEDYAELERLLLDRESDLEVMRGQLRTLGDRVDLATITLLLTQDRVENAVELQISTYRDHNVGESCPGQGSLTMEAGSAATVCFEVINVGDQTLTDITLTDTVLEIDGDTTLIEVFGSLDGLAPGQSALVAHEFTAERNLRLRTRVMAVPTDGVSAEPAGPSVSTEASFELRTFEPESSPGFGDGFSVAVSLLRGLWIAFTVVLGFLIPLLVLLPFLVLAWLAWRRLAHNRAQRRPKAPPSPMAPPSPKAPPSPEHPQEPGPESVGGEDGELATAGDEGV